MRRVYKILIWAVILALLISGFLYFPIDVWINKELLWSNYLFPIMVNIIVYLIRTILLGIINYTMHGKITRFIFSVVINLIWASFILWLVFSINGTYALAIISFLIVAISLTFRNRINNIISGAMIILTEGFEVGDLIETNGIQGIVEDITLNYTKIRQFNGIISLLPNEKVFNSKVTKFTFNTTFEEEEKSEEESVGLFEKYGEKLKHLITKGKKLTRFVKVIEIRPNVKPESLDTLLSNVFDKYEPLLGYRPIYYVNRTIFNRCNITLQLIVEDPNLIIEYANLFLKDVLFNLYSEEVFENWDGELPADIMITKQQKEDL
jgi:hypothetical protein